MTIHRRSLCTTFVLSIVVKILFKEENYMADKKASVILASVGFCAGIIALSLLKLVNPELASISGLIAMLFKRNMVACLYLVSLMTFVLISYIMVLMGLAQICRKVVTDIKGIFSGNGYEGIAGDEFSYAELGIMAVYILATLVLLYALMPALSVILFLLLIFFAICG